MPSSAMSWYTWHQPASSKSAFVLDHWVAITHSIFCMIAIIWNQSTLNTPFLNSIKHVSLPPPWVIYSKEKHENKVSSPRQMRFSPAMATVLCVMPFQETMGPAIHATLLQETRKYLSLLVLIPSPWVTWRVIGILSFPVQFRENS